MKIQREAGSIIKFIGIGVLLLLYIVPFLLVLVNSVKVNNEIIANPVSLPTSLQLSNFSRAFVSMNFLNAFSNSLIITVFGVLVVALFSSMTAYIFVRKKWAFNQLMFMAMVSAMIIPFQALMIPLVKIYGSIGFLNSKASLIYMYLGFGAPLAVFIYHGFIKNIPVELEEAALIDGCTQIQTFFKIVFPLLKTTTITIVILDVLWMWNDFLLPLLVLISPTQRTLPLSTYAFYSTYTVQYDMLMAALVLTISPILIAYIFLQKHIIQGVMQGSIK